MIKNFVSLYVQGIELDRAFGVDGVGGSRTARTRLRERTRNALIQEGVSLCNGDANLFLAQLERFQRWHYKSWRAKGLPKKYSELDGVLFSLLDGEWAIPGTPQGIKNILVVEDGFTH